MSNQPDKQSDLREQIGNHLTDLMLQTGKYKAVEQPNVIKQGELFIELHNRYCDAITKIVQAKIDEAVLAGRIELLKELLKEAYQLPGTDLNRLENHMEALLQDHAYRAELQQLKGGKI
jgi:inhibitor of KinA sporulation pathway (predicted exonuclease)